MKKPIDLGNGVDHSSPIDLDNTYLNGAYPIRFSGSTDRMGTLKEGINTPEPECSVSEAIESLPPCVEEEDEIVSWDKISDFKDFLKKVEDIKEEVENNWQLGLLGEDKGPDPIHYYTVGFLDSYESHVVYQEQAFKMVLKRLKDRLNLMGWKLTKDILYLLFGKENSIFDLKEGERVVFPVLGVWVTRDRVVDDSVLVRPF